MRAEAKMSRCIFVPTFRAGPWEELKSVEPRVAEEKTCGDHAKMLKANIEMKLQ